MGRRTTLRSSLDLNSTDLGNVVIHTGLVELHLSDELVGELLLGLLLALIVLCEHLWLDVGSKLLVEDLSSGTVEAVLAVLVEPSFAVESAGGNVLTVLLDHGLVGVLDVGKGHFLEASVND